MGGRISHMNMYALSTLVQAEEIDIENLLRNFEGKKNMYEKIEYKGREYENVPLRSNAIEEQYIVDAMEVVLERQEAEAKAKLDAIKAEEEAEKAKIEAERASRAAAKHARKSGKLTKIEEDELKAAEAAVAAQVAEQKRIEEEEAAKRPATMLNEILPDQNMNYNMDSDDECSDGLPGANNKKNMFADKYEADIEAHKAPERDEQFYLSGVNHGTGVVSSGASIRSHGSAISGDDDGDITGGIGAGGGSKYSIDQELDPGSVSAYPNDNVRSVNSPGPFDNMSVLGDDFGSVGGEMSVRFDMGPGMSPLPGGAVGAELGEDVNDAVSAYAERDEQDSLTGAQPTGSIVSVAGGGSIKSTTSVTNDMVDVNSKVHSFYSSVKIGPSKGHELPESYLINLDIMLNLVKKSGFDESDIDLIESMFRLVDQRGFEECDIRHVLVPFALAVGCKSGSVSKCIKLLFSVFDRACTECIEKVEMMKIFNLVNEGILYIGDKPLDANYIIDLTDSIFTAAGRIDGMVQWVEYIELIAEHPIVEMLLAPQYQGLARDKVFDEETLHNIDVSVGVDYSDKKGNNN
jgi:hypothetical protein